MKLLDLFKHSTPSNVKAKAEMPQDVAERLIFAGGANGNSINDPRDALEQSVWVARGIRTVATKGSSVPWVIQDASGKPIDAAAQRILNCNPWETWGELVQRVLAWIALSGFGVLYVERPMIYSYEADRVEIQARGAGLSVRYTQANGSHKILDPANLVICPGFKPFFTLQGVSDLLPAMDAANLEENAMRLTNNIMTNGGIMAGILTTEQDLAPGEPDAVKAVFKAQHAGINKAGDIGVFGRGLKWTPLGVDPSAFRAMDISSMTRMQIGAALGVPLIFLGDTAGIDYANSKTQEGILYRETIQPRLELLAERFTRFLLPLMGIQGTFKFDWTKVAALKEDGEIQARTDAARIQSGVTTINEVRARDGQDPVPWGYRPMVNAMLVPAPDTQPLPGDEPLPPDAGKALVQKAMDVLFPASQDKAVTPALTEGTLMVKGLSGTSRKAYWMTFALATLPQERKFSKVVLGSFKKQGKAVIARLQSDGVKAVKAGTMDWVDDLLKATSEYAEATRSVYYAFGMQAAEDFQARWDMANKLDAKVFQSWIDKRAVTTSKYLDDTTGADVRQILATASAEGQGIPDMVAAVQGYFDNITYRAERVARTEVIGTNNYATLEEYTENGGQYKQWLSTQDDKTRDDHAEADGQTVAINEPFTVGGESLDYPGDTAGSAENVCNCRCTWLPVTD